MVPVVGPWVVLVLLDAGPEVRLDVGLGGWLDGIVAVVVVRVPGVRAELRADVRLCGRRGAVVLWEAFVGFVVGFTFIGFVIVVIGSGSSQVQRSPGVAPTVPKPKGLTLR